MPMTPDLLHIRALTGADAAQFQALRLRALQTDPEAFGRTYEEERDMPLSALAQRLDGDGTVEGFVLGAALDDGGALEGVAGCVRQTAVKERHKAMVWGMYVSPEMRGRGVGGRLLDALIARAATWEGLEQLTLTVVPVNERARCLCLRRGFVSYGVAPRALKHQGEYHDLEYMWLPLRSE
jgi:RimJ/RimL family protein N-acetyltransferase